MAITWVPEHFYTKPEPVIDSVERIDHAEAFFAATGADLRHGGNRAFYSGGADRRVMRRLRLLSGEKFASAGSGRGHPFEFKVAKYVSKRVKRT